MNTPVLSRRLALEAPEQQPDGAGGFTTVWTRLGFLWAEITASKGRELRVEAMTVSVVPYKVIVRSAPVGALARPQAHQRFREGDRIFRILSVAERSYETRYLVCYVQEETTG